MNYSEFAPPIEKHPTLNPKLWEGMRLKSSVRGALLRIAEDFLDYVDVPVKVLDIIIAGGNANYTYTSHSDLDLHIIADFDSVACDREAAELFDTKRLLYKRDFDINIHGIPVELYIEDHREPAVSASFSLLKEQWINEPDSDIPDYDLDKLEHMIGVWKKILAQATQTGDLQTCRKAVKLLRTYRKKGLSTEQGEFSIPNLVYKSLRNDQTLEGITILINRLHDQELSIQ
jgi:hypothetical protein